jgi:hypothetical protein
MQTQSTLTYARAHIHIHTHLHTYTYTRNAHFFGYGDREYLETWDRLLLPVLRAFDPDVVVVSAGMLFFLLFFFFFFSPFISAISRKFRILITHVSDRGGHNKHNHGSSRHF